jgi:hypothetical protein
MNTRTQTLPLWAPPKDWAPAGASTQCWVCCRPEVLQLTVDSPSKWAHNLHSLFLLWRGPHILIFLPILLSLSLPESEAPAPARVWEENNGVHRIPAAAAPWLAPPGGSRRRHPPRAPPGGSRRRWPSELLREDPDNGLGAQASLSCSRWFPTAGSPTRSGGRRPLEEGHTARRLEVHRVFSIIFPDFFHEIFCSQILFLNYFWQTFCLNILFLNFFIELLIENF